MAKQKFPRKRSSEGRKQQPPAYDKKIFQKATKAGDPDHVRLNKYIANAGVCSRREADELIAKGLIKINGEVVTSLGTKVTKDDKVSYKDKLLQREQFVYVLLNKPKDYITTVDDPQERRTVMDLVGDACNERIYPVGRLDRNTTGLLLLTNDGELAERLSHPSNNIRKMYEATLDKPLAKEHFQAIEKGFDLEDGPVRLDDIAISVDDDKKVGLELHIGRNRIVRRIFENFGYEVVKLDRVLYAGLTKKNLGKGKWRYLQGFEIMRLKQKGNRPS